jgi:hypothetical protein
MHGAATARHVHATAAASTYDGIRVPQADIPPRTTRGDATTCPSRRVYWSAPGARHTR